MEKNIPFTLLAICFLASCSRSEDMLQRGEDEFQKGNYKESIGFYSQAIRVDPKNENAYLARGLVECKQHDYDAALSDYTAAIGIAPIDERPYIHRGDIRVLQKDEENAINDYNQALIINPNSAAAFCGRGAAYYKINNYDAALADLTTAIKFDAKFENAYRLRGEVYAAKLAYNQALKDLDQALQFDSQDADAYIFRGAMLLNEGRTDEAIADLSRGIEINSSGHAGMGYYCRGMSHETLGDAAISAVNKAALQSSHSPEANSAQRRLDAYAKAIDDYKAAIEADNPAPFDSSLIKKKMAGVYVKCSLLFIDEADYTKATEYASQATAYDPTSSIAYNTLAWIHATSPQEGIRDGKQAVSEALKAYELSAGNNPFTLGTLASAYAEAGNFDDAVKWQKRQLENPSLNPNEITDAKSRLALFEAHRPYHTAK